MKNIKRISSMVLSGLLVASNVMPSFAATKYVNSDYSVEYEVYDSDGEQTTDVHCEIGSVFSVRLPKDITLSGKSKSAKYNVTIDGDIAGDESIDVVPEDSFLFKQPGKDDIPASVKQDKANWKYNEFDTVGNGEISAEITAGRWDGQFVFNVELKSPKTERDIVVVTNEKGNTIAAIAKILTNTDKELIINSIKESEFASKATEESMVLDIKTENFSGTTTAVIDVSGFAKPGDEVIIFHMNEISNQWEYIGTCEVSDEYTVSGVFSSYSPVVIFKTEKKKHEQHNYKLTVSQAATCTNEGYEIYACECGDEYTQIIQKLEHNKVTGGSIEKEASCINPEIRHYKCSVCDEDLEETYESSPAGEHVFVETQIVSPTCTVNGYIEKTCSSCGCKKKETISANGHNAVEGGSVKQKADCVNPEIRYYKCENCGHDLDTTYQSADAWGHYTENTGITVTSIRQASCTQGAMVKVTCGCGKASYERLGEESGANVNPLGHNWVSQGYALSEIADYLDGCPVVCSRCGIKSTKQETNLGDHQYVWKDYIYSSGDGYERNGYILKNRFYVCKDCGVLAPDYTQGVDYTCAYCDSLGWGTSTHMHGKELKDYCTVYGQNAFVQDPICACPLSDYRIVVHKAFKDKNGDYVVRLNHYCVSCGKDYFSTVKSSVKPVIPEPTPGNSIGTIIYPSKQIVPAGEQVTVCLDPGHGGYETGAVYTYDGTAVYEKTLNYQIALGVKERLEAAGIKVIMTRYSDNYIGISDRVMYAKENGAHLLVSLHLNGSTSSAHKGCLAIVTQSNYNDVKGDSLALAYSVLTELNGLGINLTSGYPKGILQRLDEPVTYYPDGSVADWYGISRYSTQQGLPSALIEHAFLSSEYDYYNFLSSDEKIAKLSEADANGIIAYLKGKGII